MMLNDGHPDRAVACLFVSILAGVLAIKKNKKLREK